VKPSCGCAGGVVSTFASSLVTQAERLPTLSATENR